MFLKLNAFKYKIKYTILIGKKNMLKLTIIARFEIQNILTALYEF